MKKIRFTIRKKLIMGFLFVAIIPLFSTITILYTQTKDILLDSIISDEHHDITMKKVGIDNFLQGLSIDVLFLSKLSSLDSMINAIDVEGEKINRKKLEQDLLSFSKEKKIYYQIRYIDETGQEIVRVDSDGNNIASIAEEKLQNKKGRYYFDDSMKVPFGDVFISPLDFGK